MKVQQDRCSKRNLRGSVQNAESVLNAATQRTKTPYSSYESQLHAIRCELTSKTLVFMSSSCND